MKTNRPLLVLLFVVAVINTACARNASTQIEQQQIQARIVELKTMIGKKYWPTFADTKYDVPIRFFQEGTFRMQYVINDEDSYFIECSSLEIASEATSITTYNEWYGMLLHEYFHAFQHQHKKTWNTFMQSTPKDFNATDSLIALKKHYFWYHKLLNKESNLLRKAYKASSLKQARKHLKNFLSTRNRRLQKLKERLGLDITDFYPLKETIEGSARYIEYCLYYELGIDNIEWMTNLDSNAYVYSSGLYLILIMKKLGINFCDNLFVNYNTITELLNDKLKL